MPPGKNGLKYFLADGYYTKLYKNLRSPAEAY